MSLQLEHEAVVETELPEGLDVSTIEDMIGSVLEAERADGAWTVVVLLTNDAHLQDLHRDYLGVDSPTDVMTFPYDEPGSNGGDIVVSVERAAEQGPVFGLTPVEETIFLVAHGLLHLCGWDDSTMERREAMLNRQREILSGLGLIR